MDISNRQFIDVAEIAEKELGAEFEEEKSGDDHSNKLIKWENKHLVPLLDIVKVRAEPGKIITFLGHTPSWIDAALNCTVRPNLACLRIPPPIDLWADIPTPQIGQTNKDGHVSFEITEREDKICMRLIVETDSGLFTDYESKWLYRLVLPEIPQHRHLLIRGNAPNFIPAAVTRGYADWCKSVSLRFHLEKFYTCAVSNSSDRKIGDLEPCLEVCDE